MQIICASYSAEVALRRWLGTSCPTQVSLCRWLCATSSAQMALCKLVCASDSEKVARRNRLCANWSAQVILRKLLYASCSAQMALHNLICISDTAQAQQNINLQTPNVKLCAPKNKPRANTNPEVFSISLKSRKRHRRFQAEVLLHRYMEWIRVAHPPPSPGVHVPRSGPNKKNMRKHLEQRQEPTPGSPTITQEAKHIHPPQKPTCSGSQKQYCFMPIVKDLPAINPACW